jgi:hypothetical protein
MIESRRATHGREASIVSDATASSRRESAVFDRWSSRKVPPVVLIYVVGVFAAFIALSIFVFRSPDAVKALLIAAVGAVVATVPGVMEKVEYQMTEVGIEKRASGKKEPSPFEVLFRWDELDRVVPMRHGFKYYKTMNETKPLRRFWKTHVSDRYSGEVHVEKADLERVLDGTRRCRAGEDG